MHLVNCSIDISVDSPTEGNITLELCAMGYDVA
jgi:hypothetical protein